MGGTLSPGIPGTLYSGTGGTYCSGIAGTHCSGRGGTLYSGVLTWVMDYYQTMSDAPREFLYCSALMTATAVIGNKVYCQLGHQRVKPNLYMLLLAGSTVSRKSTAVSYTVQGLNELERKLDVPFLMPDSGSLEGMIEAMREARAKDIKKRVMNSGIACYSELASFLDNMRKEYNKDFQTFIIDVYDGNRYRRQLKHEEAIINNPCLSIFGGITMAQFSKKVTEDDKHSGFLQRFLICTVPSKIGRMKSLVERAIPSKEMEDSLFNMLEAIYVGALKIQESGKPFLLSDNAAQVYQDSFNADQDFIEHLQMIDPELAGMLQGYHGRLDVVKIKLAMTYETVQIALKGIEITEQTMYISEESMSQGVKAVEYFWRAMAFLLKQNFKFNAYMQKLPRIIEILQKHKGKLPSRILQKHMGTMPEGFFQKVLHAGVESGILLIAEEKTLANQTSRVVRLI